MRVCVFDFRSGGRELDSSPVLYFRGNRSWKIFYLFQLIYSRWFVFIYKRKYVLEVLVNPLFKFAYEKSVVKWHDHPNMTIAVDWDIKQQTNKKKLPDTHLCDNRMMKLHCFDFQPYIIAYKSLSHAWLLMPLFHTVH